MRPAEPTWPVTSFTTFGNNTTYLLAGLGNIPQGPAKAGVQTNLVVATATNQTLSVLGFASGAPTITYQWWLAPQYARWRPKPTPPSTLRMRPPALTS